MLFNYYLVEKKKNCRTFDIHYHYLFSLPPLISKVKKKFLLKIMHPFYMTDTVTP